MKSFECYPYLYSKRLSELVAFVGDPSFNVKEEYEHLNHLDNQHNVMVQSKTEAQKWRGGGDDKLNRYGNILPYDKTRVVLRDNVTAGATTSSGNCDYINASWIKYGYYITIETFLHNVINVIFFSIGVRARVVRSSSSLRKGRWITAASTSGRWSGSSSPT